MLVEQSWGRPTTILLAQVIAGTEKYPRLLLIFQERTMTRGLINND